MGFTVYSSLENVIVKESQHVDEKQKLGTIKTMDQKTVLEFQLYNYRERIDSLNYFFG